jgi:hypothetical protein
MGAKNVTDQNARNVGSLDILKQQNCKTKVPTISEINCGFQYNAKLH